MALLAEIANSAFTTSLLGSLAGALGGAYAAQRIANRARAKEELLAEIRAVNSAIAVTFSIANLGLSIKRQHVHPLAKKHREDRTSLEKFKANLKSGAIPPQTPFSFQADFRSIEPITTPVDSLSQAVFTKLTTVGRPLNIVISLAEAINRLNKTIDKRNRLIARFQAMDLPAGSNLPALYFGFPYDGGHVNQEYPDCVEGMESYTDDLIFYSALLCRDLNEHGNRLLSRYKESFGVTTHKITEVSFDTPEAKPFMPLESRYESVFTAFQEHEKAKVPWWRR